MVSKVVLLHPGTTGGSTASQQGNSTRLVDLLNAKKIDYMMVDGTNPEQKTYRDLLFSVSGIRGNYPQLFLCEDGDFDHPKFVGGWSKIEELNECNEVRTGGWLRRRGDERREKGREEKREKKKRKKRKEISRSP